MKYVNIIFIQSIENHIKEHEQDNINCPITKVWENLSNWPNQEDEEKLFRYLTQWDFGTDSEYDISTKLSAGLDDTIREFGDYILTYNTKLGYSGLERIIY